MPNEKETKPVIIKLPKGTEQKAANLKLYLVNKQGEVIESHPVNTDEIKLGTHSEDIEGKVTVYIAPQLPAELSKIVVNEKVLQKMNAWRPSLRLTPDSVLKIPYIPHLTWPLLFGWCNISGTVTKTFTVNGSPQVLPICDARVHICDVERIWLLINRIPEDILNDFRYRLTNIIRVPIHGPGPDPEPGTRFGERVAHQLDSLAQTKELISDLPNRPELPLNIQNSILSGSTESFRNLIAHNFDLFHPYLCWWPWLHPWFYEFEEIATVTTDCNGRFGYNMIYFFKNHPNVYVWVEVFIGGSWITVYKPAISCYTHWNYSCGTDISISVTDPGVLPCFCDNPSIEADYILIENVNNGVSIRSIQQTETPGGHLNNAVGLTAYGGYGNISPFGSSFPFVVQFGDGFEDLGVTHYRWSYTQKKDAYLTGVPDGKHLIGGTLSKPYFRWIEITPGDWERLPGSFALGPFSDTSGFPMYKIPHTNAAVDVGILGVVWDSPDTESVNINTEKWNPGLYQFTIELLDDFGNVVPLTNNPFKVNRLSTDPAPAVPGVDTINAEGLAENYLIKNPDNKITGFQFLMRVDNDHCYAGISDAIVAGGTTDTECGTGYYNDKNNDKVDLIFQAGHPHNFATYDFNVYKGNSGTLAVAATSGTSANANNALLVTAGNNFYDITAVDILVPVSITPPNPENPVSNMDQYHKSIPVNAMLGNCTMAAFSENVGVAATHTNGNNRIDAYDAACVAAIAIAPGT